MAPWVLFISFLIIYFSSSANLCIFREFFWLQVAECQNSGSKCKPIYLFLKKSTDSQPRMMQQLVHIIKGRISPHLFMDSFLSTGFCHAPWWPLTQWSHQHWKRKDAKEGSPPGGPSGCEQGTILRNSNQISFLLRSCLSQWNELFTGRQFPGSWNASPCHYMLELHHPHGRCITAWENKENSAWESNVCCHKSFTSVVACIGFNVRILN